MQCTAMGTTRPSFIDGLQTLWKGGILNMWKGSGLNVVRIVPQTFLQFGAYDLLVGLMDPHLQKCDTSQVRILHMSP